MKVFNLLLFLLFLCVSVSCDKDKEINEGELKGEWVCVKNYNISSDTIIPFVLEKTTDSYIINFNSDRTFNGKSAANVFSGKYKLEGENIQLFDIIITKIGLVDPFELVIDSVHKYHITNNELILYYNNGKGGLYFTKK